ncbi:hypothetical protein ACG04R_19780 [Roseateles sp. BYS78W]|uniref:Big-1 domain-containing protein n=1 Tax=Pelomonas candidula TaxID=3299025 RepID=A0ABW7HGB3_9BURK
MLQTIVTQGWRRLAQAALGLGMAALLSACGGGGGSAGDPVVGGGSGTGSGGTTDTAKVSVALSSTTVTAGAPATVSVTVVNKSGAVLPGLVVKFATASGLGSLSATSALTDASGKASVVLSPATAATTGADTLTATVSYLGTDYSASTGFQLNATNVTISSFTSDVSTLSAYGTSTLSVTLGGTSATSSVSLTMTSSCVTVGKATLTPASVNTATGKATFTLRDQGCGAVQSSDNLTLAVTGTTLTQSLSLPVSSPTAASIGFVSASPTNIYLKGSGLTESSLVTFQVKDASNNGLPGQTVVLTPNVLVGGLTLDDQTGSVTKTTDSSGNVIVRINSGTVPTPVRVKATLQGSNISTVSSALSIAVGLPSQLNFSLAQGTQNIEGYDIQGTTNTYTVIASDRLGNPVPDGTAINFVTTAGQINASKQTAVNANGIATATANFASASPVPVDGRVTVVAYALGEKSFLDVNGNNVYDAGEDFQDLGDIFIDRKFDNYYNAADDQYISLSTGVGSLACVAATSPLLATDVSIPVRPNTCNQTWGQAYVRRAVQTIFSRSTANPVWGIARNVNEGPPSATNRICSTAVSLIKNYTNNVANTASYYPVAGSSLYFGSNVSGSFSMFVADSNATAFNPMPAGTTISVSATDGITASVLGGTPVPSTLSPTGLSIGYKFGTASSGTITINITSPGGTVTAVPVNVATGAAPAACSN